MRLMDKAGLPALWRLHQNASTSKLVDVPVAVGRCALADRATDRRSSRTRQQVDFGSQYAPQVDDAGSSDRCGRNGSCNKSRWPSPHWCLKTSVRWGVAA